MKIKIPFPLLYWQSNTTLSTHTPCTQMIFGEENHQTSSLYVNPNTKIIPYKEKSSSAGPTKTRATMGNLDTPTCESLEPT